MKLISVTFLLCALAILHLPTPSSSLLVKSPTQGSDEKSVIKMATRKLLIISSEHANVAAPTVHDKGSSEQLQVTSSGKSKDEEENALSKYLSMDYPKFRRRRPVHNKSLPLRP